MFLCIGVFFIIGPLQHMDSQRIPSEQELVQYQGKVEKIVNVSRKDGDDYLLLQDGKRFLLPGSYVYELQEKLVKGYEVVIQANREDTGRLRLYTLQRKHGGEVLISYKEAAFAYDAKLKEYIIISIIACVWTAILVVPFICHKCKKRRKHR